MPHVLVSACLAGKACRYDGTANTCEAVVRMVEEGRALPVCPEELGGLPTPREPVEVQCGRAMTPSGRDVTDAFERGAREAVRLGLEAGCTSAVLKARSPSCGVGIIYDGTFTHTRIPGDGFFAGEARRAGLALHTEESLPEEI